MSLRSQEKRLYLWLESDAPFSYELTCTNGVLASSGGEEVAKLLVSLDHPYFLLNDTLQVAFIKGEGSQLLIHEIQ